MFRHAGRHYIFASHLTGWDPNPPILHESTAGGMCSTFWRVLPQPSHGTQAGTTYDAQVRGSQQSAPAAAYLLHSESLSGGCHAMIPMSCLLQPLAPCCLRV